MTIQNWVLGQSVDQRQAQQGIPTFAMTALGSTQATALAAPTDFLVFTTVAAGTGVKLLPGGDTTVPGGHCQTADTMTVINHGANALLVYPVTGGTIANGAANTPLSVPATKTATFIYISSNNWAGSVSA